MPRYVQRLPALEHLSLGAVDPAALEFLQVPALSSGNSTTRVVNANFTGDLGEYGLTLPSAKDGIAVNVGGEWRDESTAYLPDYIYQTGGLTGQGAPTRPVSGSFSVKELFFEGRIPIAQNMAFAKTLSAEVGYRYSDYNLGFDTDSYKFGLEWAPVDDIRLRGGFNRAVRAPNIGELFGPVFVSLDGTTDPCASKSGTSPRPTTRWQRKRTAPGPACCLASTATLFQRGSAVQRPARGQPEPGPGVG